jgi:hypothetical protein
VVGRRSETRSEAEKGSDWGVSRVALGRERVRTREERRSTPEVTAATLRSVARGLPNASSKTARAWIDSTRLSGPQMVVRNGDVCSHSVKKKQKLTTVCDPEFLSTRLAPGTRKSEARGLRFSVGGD